MPKGKKLPKDVIDHWPDILKDVDIEVVPMEYLHSITIQFVDGKIWEIDTTKNPEKINLEEAIEDLLEEYEDTIAKVDFKLDTVKVKQDIQSRTRAFMKKRK